MPSYTPEVIADDSDKWVANSLRFDTEEAAKAYLEDLRRRWMLVRDTRVVMSTESPNYSWKNNGPVRIGD